jgi:hypothetical protein
MERVTTPLEPTAATLTVWTEKEGLLSKVAHDLSILATELRAALSLDGARATVEVVVPVRGLRVQGQVKDGRVTPLSDKDHREIDATLQGKDVLDAARHPEVRYAGELARPGASGDVQVAGRLTLRGRTEPLPLVARIEVAPDRWVVTGEVRLRQTAWGLKPYSALLGALKVKDEVRVTWRLEYAPAPAAGP